MNVRTTRHPGLARHWPLLRAFLRCERLKLHRSRVFKIMLVATAITPVVTLAVLAQIDGQAVAFPRALELIGAFLLILTTMNALLLVTTILGDEFEQRTARVAIERGIPRWVFIVGKEITLIYAALIYALIGWVCSGGVALISQAIRFGPQGGLWLWLLVLCTSGLDAAAVAILAAAAYTGLALIGGMIVHSPAFTLFIGLGLFLVDLLITGNLGFAVSLGTYKIASVFNNAVFLLNSLQFSMAPLALIQHNAPFYGDANIQPLTALAVLLGYALGGTAIAIGLFWWQDLDAAR
ncbi:MAG: ABC transporter permease [Anaerolineae bacterium]|nr:ABC transporter permease [Anaerolineae bacterium]